MPRVSHPYSKLLRTRLRLQFSSVIGIDTIITVIVTIITTTFITITTIIIT